MPCRSRHSASAALLAVAALISPATMAAASGSATASASAEAPVQLILDPTTTQTLLVAVRVNGANQGVALLLRDRSGEYYADAQTLESWHVARPYPPPKTFKGQPYYALEDFRGIATTFVERDMSASIAIPPPLLIGTQRSLATRDRLRPTGQLGAFLDYDVSYVENSTEQGQSVSSLLSPTVFTANGSLSSDLLYNSAPSAAGRRGWARLATTWTRDVPAKARTWRVGDAVTPAGNWARSLRFGGFQIATNFATRPDEVTFPQPSISGTAAVPSAVDVFVNGSLRSRTNVPSGLFEIDSIPVVTGAGEIQMVTRDLLGREQIVTENFYTSERLLRPGLNEYSLSAGRVRNDFGGVADDYGDLLISGRLRRGVSSQLTIEGRLDAAGGVSAAGFALARTVARAGVTSAAFAVSTGDGTGELWQVGHEYQARKFRANLRLQGTSARFAQPGLGALAPFPRLQVVASGGVAFRRQGSLGLSVVSERFSEADQNRRIFVASYSRSLPHGLLLAASVSRIRGNGADTGIGVTVNRIVGPRISASTTLRTQGGKTSTRMDYRYELPEGPGLGYRTSFVAGDDNAREADVAVNTAAARYSAELRHSDTGRGWRLQTQGSVAAIDGEMFAARDINDGFAVVDAGGFGGVRVYLENREVGVTDRRGRLLVPNLRPYETNRVRVESADLPLTARIENPSLQLVPYYRSGTVASFGVDNSVSGVLRAVEEDGAPVPEGARARTDDGDFRLPVGLQGRLYLQDLREGTHVEIEYAGRRCAFDVGPVGAPALLVDLGDVVCHALQSPAEAPTGRPADQPKPPAAEPLAEPSPEPPAAGPAAPRPSNEVLPLPWPVVPVPVPRGLSP